MPHASKLKGSWLHLKTKPRSPIGLTEAITDHAIPRVPFERDSPARGSRATAAREPFNDSDRFGPLARAFYQAMKKWSYRQYRSVVSVSPPPPRKALMPNVLIRVEANVGVALVVRTPSCQTLKTWLGKSISTSI